MSSTKQGERILVTGGAGFIGSSLVPLLIENGYSVIVYDLFSYGAETLLSCSLSSNLKLVKGDIRNEDDLKHAMQDVDVVIHLAALVGFPICSKYPEDAQTTNVDGTRLIIKHLKPNQKFVFASTGSCYGAIPNGYCTEETPLNPLSLYGTTKTECENMIKDSANKGVILRLATIFGVSQRLRLDLLINDLVFNALRKERIDIYEPNFKRTFLHVKDVARAFMFAVQNYDQMRGEVYNVGGDMLNYTKWEICQIISKYVPSCEFIPSEKGTDADKRDYKVIKSFIRLSRFFIFCYLFYFQ